MQIHTTKPGEKISDIAAMHGVSEESVRMINEITEGEPCEGEELLILIPTRTYTVQYGDSLDRIALRFGIPKSSIIMLNPWLEKDPVPGQKIALKYGERRGGMAMANGYFYKGCDRQKLKRAMPYLTYITFAGAVADEDGIGRCTNFKAEVKIALEGRKIPLLRIYDKHPERYSTDSDLTRFCEDMIGLAKDGGYKGIIIDSCPLSNSAENFMSFLIKLRKLMIGCDLILITEINENSPTEFSEFADGSVIYYPKYAMENPPKFHDGEREILADFACRGESAKAFIDLPSLAKYGSKFTTVNEALQQARKHGFKVETNENTLLSHIRDRRQGEYTFSSLKNIKALLELVTEFDYMGVCFDIMRTPLSHLMMYNNIFKTHYLSPIGPIEQP